MRAGKTKFAWFLVCVLFAIYALGVMLDLLLNRRVEWYEAAGVGGMLLDLVLTSAAWRKGPPRSAQSRPAPLGEQ